MFLLCFSNKYFEKQSSLIGNRQSEESNLWANISQITISLNSFEYSSPAFLILNKMEPFLCALEFCDCHFHKH